MNLSMFLELDQEEAKKLLNAYDYNHMNALEKTAQGNFLDAAIYHRNVAHQLEQLQALKNNKDQVDLILKQIEGERAQKALLHKLQVNIYE